jgi:hypothetical protein
MSTWAFFSTLPGQVLLWGISGALFWVLSKIPDRESLEFIVLDGLVLVSGLLALFTLPFVLMANDLVTHRVFSGGAWMLAVAGISLLLCIDAFTKMRVFFLD